MASFYGNHVVSGGGGSTGTTNYNNLINIPIKNLKGTDTNPIVFSDLDYGNYLMSGYYQYNANSLVCIESIPTNIQVFQDTITLQKVVCFEIFENNEYFLVTLTYEHDNSYIEQRLNFKQIQDSGELSEAVVLAIAQSKEEAVLESKQYIDECMTLHVL